MVKRFDAVRRANGILQIGDKLENGATLLGYTWFQSTAGNSQIGIVIYDTDYEHKAKIGNCAALSFNQTAESVDIEHIALWGSSFPIYEAKSLCALGKVVRERWENE
jgi:hypothetical protein